jgi:hypothetical protein
MPDNPKQEPDKLLGGRGHKSTCECKTCLRIREMHTLGEAKSPDKRRLGPIQVKKKAFVKAITDPLSETFGNQGKSAQAAGYAASSGNALMKDPQVQNMMRAALGRNGIDDDYLALGLKEGLRADEVKLATFEGKFTDERRVPDFRARARFHEITHRLRGDLQDEAAVASLIILHVPQPSFTEGHAAECACAECLAAFEKSREAE